MLQSGVNKPTNRFDNGTCEERDGQAYTWRGRQGKNFSVLLPVSDNTRLSLLSRVSTHIKTLYKYFKKSLCNHSYLSWVNENGVYFQGVPPDSKLQSSGSFPGHELHGGSVTLSPHLRWLASCSPDGKLLLRAVGALVGLDCISYFT